MHITSAMHPQYPVYLQLKETVETTAPDVVHLAEGRKDSWLHVHVQYSRQHLFRHNPVINPESI